MDYTKLSKEISYALRHAPWEYELELDREGFVPVEQLLNAVNETGKYDRIITANDLLYIIETSDKKRHELSDGRIRALYGHSVPMHISKKPLTPPDILFHGTTHRAFEVIMKEGLKPMNRQYVHLSVDAATARKVGSRHDKNPVILVIDAPKMYSDGFKFFHSANDGTWMCESVPSNYIIQANMHEV